MRKTSGTWRPVARRWRRRATAFIDRLRGPSRVVLYLNDSFIKLAIAEELQRAFESGARQKG